MTARDLTAIGAWLLGLVGAFAAVTIGSVLLLPTHPLLAGVALGLGAIGVGAGGLFSVGWLVERRSRD